jgi:hypothetical protein
VSRLRRTSAPHLRLRTILAAATILLTAGSAPAWACPVCFGAEETPLIDGAKLGVIVLLAVLLVVQGGFVSFFLYLRKRAKRVAELELETEWSELQRGSET